MIDEKEIKEAWNAFQFELLFSDIDTVIDCAGVTYNEFKQRYINDRK